MGEFILRIIENARPLTHTKINKLWPIIDEWINKIWHSHHDGVLFGLMKECHSDTCSHVDEPCRHSTKQKKPDLTHITRFHLHEVFRIYKSIETESRQVVSRAWEWAVNSDC